MSVRSQRPKAVAPGERKRRVCDGRFTRVRRSHEALEMRMRARPRWVVYRALPQTPDGRGRDSPKSLRGASPIMASALAVWCSVRTRSDSIAFDRVPPAQGTPRGAVPPRGSTRVAPTSPFAPAECHDHVRGDPSLHGDGSVMLACAIRQSAGFCRREMVCPPISALRAPPSDRGYAASFESDTRRLSG